MQFIHRIGALEARKEIKDDPQLLLTNKHGSFFYWQENPSSRYQGWYVRGKGGVHKTIAELRLGTQLAIKRITHSFSSYEIERTSGIRETYFLDPDSNSLVWQANEAIPLSVYLDGKEIFDNDDQGRFYDISAEDGCIVIEFSKRKEDALQYRFTLAIAGVGGSEVKKEWVKRDYERDRERNDFPFERFVFRAVELKGRRFVFSVAQDKDTAKETAKRVYNETEKIKKAMDAEDQWFMHKYDCSAPDMDTRLAYCAAKLSLQRMVVRDEWKNAEGLYAGIPWFAQYWMRDFAISAGQLDVADAHAIIMRSVEEYASTGKLSGRSTGSLAYADTELFFFWRIQQLCDAGACTDEEKKSITTLLVAFLENELPKRMQNGLVVNGPKETWMDTEYKGSARAGARVEIQALACAVLAWAAHLTGEKKYADQEAAVLRAAREALWDGSILADGAGDTAIRPNCFLAHRIYPNMLLKHEWEKAFAGALTALWLPWGGIATIAKDHPLFCGVDRGCEYPNQSYHHGNAWFFVNNIAAREMHLVNKEKFAAYIDAIMATSTRDILWSGIFGHHSEVSSANQFSPTGCLAQSWSAATYCDAIDSMMRPSNPPPAEAKK